MTPLTLALLWLATVVATAATVLVAARRAASARYPAAHREGTSNPRPMYVYPDYSGWFDQRQDVQPSGPKPERGWSTFNIQEPARGVA